MQAVIAGCGRVGAQLALLLSYEGHNVVVIDRDPEAFRRLESPFNGLTLVGIAFDEELLKEAGIEGADAFVSVTNYDNTNLMAAEIAADLFEVPRVVARVYNPDKEFTYRKLGIDYLCGSTIMAEALHRMVTAGRVRKHLEKGDGFQVLEVDLGEESEGLRIRDLRAPGKGRIMALMRDNRPLFFDRDTVLRPGDTLLVSVDPRREGPLQELVTAATFRFGPRGSLERSRLVEVESGGEGERLRVVVAGCGRVGSQVAEMLSMDGHDVRVIDSDPRAFSLLSKSFMGEVYEGMAFDMEVMRAAGVEGADVFLALTRYDNTNLMAAEVARRIYGVKKVITRLYNPDKGRTWQALGIEYLCGTSLLAELFMERVADPRLVVKGWTGNNSVSLVEFACPSRFHRRKVERVEKEELLRIGLVTRGMVTRVATKDTELNRGDVLTAAVLSPRLHKVRRMVE